MADRYVLVRNHGEKLLRAVPQQSVKDENWLQEEFKHNIELIPAQDFGLRRPLLVVGRETSLAEAGWSDLIAVDMTGEVLVAEFKRGPDNPDARHVVAQLLDYGSQLWGMSYDEFDRVVARRYFDSDRCHDESLQGKSLAEAAESLWGVPVGGTDTPPAEYDPTRFPGKLGAVLSEGRLTYVAVSTRITDKVRRVLRYLTRTSRFQACAIEISHFADHGLSVFVPTSISFGRDTGSPTTRGRNEFLSALTPHGREIFGSILDYLETTGETIYWGTVGFSFRPEFSGRGASIFYGFPARRSGGADQLQVYFPQLESAGVEPGVVARYREATKKLPGIRYTKSGKTGDVLLTEKFTREHVEQVVAALDALLASRNAG